MEIGLESTQPKQNSNLLENNRLFRIEPLKQVVSTNTSALLSYVSSTSKSVLATNINIDNVRASPSSLSHNSLESDSSMSSGKNKRQLSLLQKQPHHTNDDDIISYQRVKKVIRIDTTSIDDEIEAREAYLNHLKSIDLDKYSFPNENLPRTDYTYARTSSYLMESKHLIDDTLGMPNLCRRGRKSPSHYPTSTSSSTPSSSASSISSILSSPQFVYSSLSNLIRRVSTTNEATSTSSTPVMPRFSSPIATVSPPPPPTTSQTHENSTIRSGFCDYYYDYFRTAVLNSIERTRRSFSRQSPPQGDHQQQEQPHHSASTSSPILTTAIRSTSKSSTPKRVHFKESHDEYLVSSSADTHSKQQLNRNLNNDLDEAVASTAMSDSGRGETNTDPSPSPSSSSTRMTLRGSAALSSASGASAAQRKQQLTANMKSFANKSTMTNGGGGDGGGFFVFYSDNRPLSLATCCCSKLFWLLLLLLLPFLFLGASRVYEAVGDETNSSRLKTIRFYLEPNEDTLAYLRHILIQPFEFVRYVFADCLPHLFAFIFMPLFSSKQQSQANNVYHGNIVPDFKPASSGDYDMSLNILSTSNQSELLADLNLMKEKIISEIMLNINISSKSERDDLDLVRRELDQKFNYTLMLMYNKLADQLADQIEAVRDRAKQDQEAELSKIKSVLNELDARYAVLLARLQEKTTAEEQEQQRRKHEQQQQQQQQEQQKQQSSRIETIFSSDEHVSFRTLEEYVHRIFQVYNADRTGRTDFASESIGGSILFTKCTEPYLDNARWFTVFDVPITRISVSPRVIIQNSIQPGNCWSFKGSKADIFIKLAAKITPTSFSIEHIPKELSLTGQIDSAPQNFTVYGYENKDLISDDRRLLLGNYRYDNESKSTLQFFDAQHFYADKPIGVVELRIESNAGNKDYTCLYKFRVHGHLFSSSSADSSSSSSNAETYHHNTQTATNQPQSNEEHHGFQADSNSNN